MTIINLIIIESNVSNRFNIKIPFKMVSFRADAYYIYYIIKLFTIYVDKWITLLKGKSVFKAFLQPIMGTLSKKSFTVLMNSVMTSQNLIICHNKLHFLLLW